MAASEAEARTDERILTDGELREAILRAYAVRETNARPEPGLQDLAREVGSSPWRTRQCRDALREAGRLPTLKPRVKGGGKATDEALKAAILAEHGRAVAERRPAPSAQAVAAALRDAGHTFDTQRLYRLANELRASGAIVGGYDHSAPPRRRQAVTARGREGESMPRPDAMTAPRAAAGSEWGELIREAMGRERRRARWGRALAAAVGATA